VAKKYSDDPSVLSNSGEMGWSARGRMVPEYEAMAFKLKPKEISMPFASAFGIHIMQLIERRGNEYNSRHILISPKPSQDDINKATRYLDSIRTLIFADSMTFQKAAKNFPMMFKQRAMVDSLAIRMEVKPTVDELDPIVFFKLDSVEIGKISNP
jgi:peptidyl-prolyl cis-trans isomerase SurA